MGYNNDPTTSFTDVQSLFSEAFRPGKFLRLKCSVAFDAGIVSPKFYSALVVAAVLTSQIAGAWLGSVLHKGWPLLVPTPSDDPRLRRRKALRCLRSLVETVFKGMI
jgi:hypothetical protein